VRYSWKPPGWYTARRRSVRWQQRKPKDADLSQPRYLPPGQASKEARLSSPVTWACWTHKAGFAAVLNGESGGRHPRTLALTEASQSFTLYRHHGRSGALHLARPAPVILSLPTSDDQLHLLQHDSDVSRSRLTLYRHAGFERY
jgi:hypothetical protein